MTFISAFAENKPPEKLEYVTGDIVKILLGHPIIFEGKQVDISSHLVGKLARVTEYNKPGLYEIELLENNNRIAWFSPDQLELVESRNAAKLKLDLAIKVLNDIYNCLESRTISTVEEKAEAFQDIFEKIETTLTEINNLK